MLKTFEYGVGDAWLLGIGKDRVTYEVKASEYRESDKKEIYTVEIDGKERARLTRNRLHYLLHHYLLNKTKSGRHQKYNVQLLTEESVRKFYGLMRRKEDMRLEALKEKLESDEEYRAARSAVKGLEIEIAKAEFYAPDPFCIMELRQKLESERQRYSDLLRKRGVFPDALERRYQCKKCKDTGFFGGGFCECVKQHEREIEEMQERQGAVRNG